MEPYGGFREVNERSRLLRNVPIELIYAIGHYKSAQVWDGLSRNYGYVHIDPGFIRTTHVLAEFLRRDAPENFLMRDALVEEIRKQREMERIYHSFGV